METTTAKVQTITPDMALKMLETNIEKNRKVRNDRVRLYAENMRLGHWRMTGEPIIFNDGELIDGQHRLLACVEAKTPFTTLVVQDVAPDAFTFLNSGLPRSVGDILSHNDHKNANNLGAAVKLVLTSERNLPAHSKNRRVGSNDEVLDEANTHRDLYDRASKLANLAQREGYLCAALTAFYVLLSRAVSEDAAVEFITPAIEGVGLEAGDPRLALRRWVIQGKRTSDFHLAAWIRAWNAHANRESLKMIKSWVSGTPFPKIKVPAKDSM